MKIKVCNEFRTCIVFKADRIYNFHRYLKLMLNHNEYFSCLRMRCDSLHYRSDAFVLNTSEFLVSLSVRVVYSTEEAL